MSYPVPTASSDRKTVTSSSQQFDTTMAAGEFYVMTSTVSCYIAQGSNPTAAASDGSTIISAGESVLIDATIGAKLAIIRIGSSDGEATLTRVSFAK